MDGYNNVFLVLLLGLSNACAQRAALLRARAHSMPRHCHVSATVNFCVSIGAAVHTAVSKWRRQHTHLTNLALLQLQV
jgi:hypothetical protein